MKIDPEKCIACFRCEEVCQYDAIAYHINEEGVMLLFINDSCKKCGDCMKACFGDAISNS